MQNGPDKNRAGERGDDSPFETMKFRFRSADIANPKEMRFIAETDAAIPPLHDSDFKCDEETIQKEIEFLTTKIQPDDFFEVIEDQEGQIVGFHIVRKSPYIRNLFAGMVYTLWVDPKHRQKGLGRELKIRAETWAKKLGLDHIFTWINTRNEPSISLNQKLGYEIVNYKFKKKL